MWLRIGTLAAVSLFVLSSLIVDTYAQTPSNTDAPGVTSPADSDVDIDPPRLTYAPGPRYPRAARNVGHQGTSILSLVIGTNGRPHDITILRPLDEELDACAIAAVRKWRYKPALRDGEPLEAKPNEKINFPPHKKSYGRFAVLWARPKKSNPGADLQLSKAYIDGNG